MEPVHSAPENTPDLDNGSGTVRVVCGWCGRLLNESRNIHAPTSHGLCARCARVLDGPEVEPQHGDVLSALEYQVNALMCHVYQTRQFLLGVQQRVGTSGELLGQVGQALASLRQQERAVSAIQEQIASVTPDDLVRR